MSSVAQRDRRARTATAALFFTNGALFANLLPRFPEIKADLGMSNSTYGLSVAAFSGGALIAAPSAAALIRRYGSARVAVLSTVLIAVFALLAGVAPSAVTFAGAMLLAGAADGVTDVAQNAHGLRVQRRYRRSLINSFHAVWSAGAILGGAMGAAAIALHVGRGPHLATSAVVFSAICLIAYPFLLRGPGEQERDRGGQAGAHTENPAATPRPATYAVLAALVVIAIAGAVAEDSGSSWATLYLRGLGAPGATAVSGYLALVGCQFAGRLVGDRLVDRFGQPVVVRTGGLIVAAGMAMAIALPGIATAIVGFGAAGLGSATLIPAAMHGADELPGLRRGTGLTAVTWLLRLGFVGSPPLVGFIADATSLRVGLLVVPVAGLVVALLAGALARCRPPASPASPASPAC